jgi:molecular chaperone GrpE
MADPRRNSAMKSNGTSARKRINISEPGEEKEPLNEAPEMEVIPEEIKPDDRKPAPDTEPDPARAQLQERLLRLQAEFDNYRKRQARDFRKLCSQGKKELIKDLLPVLDNFHRAEQLVKEGGHSVEEIADGLLKTSEQLLGILRQEGLSELEVKQDDPFDPNIHEAMLAESRDDIDQDTVLSVFQKGYNLDQDLLRPARVLVGKPVLPSSSPKKPEENGGE